MCDANNNIHRRAVAQSQMAAFQLEQAGAAAGRKRAQMLQRAALERQVGCEGQRAPLYLPGVARKSARCAPGGGCRG
jgi:prolyl-tRNA editing enzyme YbaK/EbsC (Cys-tRNA(Pro) deacylase)